MVDKNGTSARNGLMTQFDKLDDDDDDDDDDSTFILLEPGFTKSYKIDYLNL